MAPLSSVPGGTLPSGIVLTLSAGPLYDHDLPAGPLRLLLVLRQLAGHSRTLTTYTRSLATLCRRCVNTIRTWRDVLVERGYIHASTCPRTMQTTYRIREAVEPPSRRAQIEEQRRIDAFPEPLPWQPPKPVVMKPDRKPWWQRPEIIDWKERTRSKACQGGAQFFAAIKSRLEKEGQRRGQVAPKPLDPTMLCQMADRYGLG